MRHIGDDERRRRLAFRHLLVPSERVERVVDVADALVALHSSDPVSVYLAAATRMNGPSLTSIDRELYGDRTLLRHHAMRRTLWVMTIPVARDAHAGFSRRIARAERSRTAKLFDLDERRVDEAIERVVAVIESADGEISTRQLAAALPDLAEPVAVNQGTNYEGKMSLHTRALLIAAFEARIARTRAAGTWIASQYGWTDHRRWVADGDWRTEPDESTGATSVVRRWLGRFGPAPLDDIVWWTGATKTLIRTALASIQPDEVELDDGSVGYVLAGDNGATAAPPPWIALLPGLDPTSMGWKRRSWYLDDDTAHRVTDRNGNIGPTMWVDGRIVGGWVQRSDGSIAHDADDLSSMHRSLLDTEIQRLQALVGESRFTIRFPSPNQKALLAVR